MGPNLTEDLWDTGNLLQSDQTEGRDPVSCYTQKVKEKDKRGREEEEKKVRKERKERLMTSCLQGCSIQKKLELPN